MKKILITTGPQEKEVVEEFLGTEEELLAYLEGEQAGGERWIKAWIQEEENVFRDYQDPTIRRSIPTGAIPRMRKKTLKDKEGQIIGHYRIDHSTPRKIFFKGQAVTDEMLRQDPSLQEKIDEVVALFQKGEASVQDNKEVVERWGIRVEREIESITYYQEYSQQ